MLDGTTKFAVTFSGCYHHDLIYAVELSQVEWGNIVRKINFADGADAFPEPTYDPDGGNGEDPFRFAYGSDVYVNGMQVSPWTGKDPAVIQTNFYGTSVTADPYKIRETALMGAFKGPEELMSFINNLMTFINNRHEQFVETLARGALVNYILGKELTDQTDTSAGKTKYHVVHLLSEYNTQTGLSLTATTVYQPDNFPAFMKWVFGRVAGISDLMTERSNLFHTDLVKTLDFGGGEVKDLYVLRHTPKRDQKVLLYAPTQHMYAARALADTYHDTYLRYADVELVNHFGDLSSPQKVIGNCQYLNPNGNGALLQSDLSGEVTVDKIFGLILDRNTVGYMRQNTRVLTSPFNPVDQSYTIWWHLAGKWVNDFSENGCLFLLD